MIDALHNAGHKYLKILFVLALAGSSALFFIGAAIPKPPVLLVVIVGAVLGVAIEWSYFVVSCDLTESISEGNRGAIVRNLLYTLIGGAASWFLFTNAALILGWAPRDELIGLDRVTWAKIMALLIVLVIFVLSARRKRVTDSADLQAIGRAVTVMLPQADDATRLRLLSEIASAASKSSPNRPRRALPPAQVVEEDEQEEDAPSEQEPEEQPPLPARREPTRRPASPRANTTGRLKRGWQTMRGREGAQDEGKEAGEQEPISPIVPEVAPRIGSTPEDAAGMVAAWEAIGYRLVPKEMVQPGKLDGVGEVVGDGPAVQRALETKESLSPAGDAASPRGDWTLPLPGVRPLTNHRNHGDMRGTFEQWSGEGESANDGPSFRG